jgi:hypothetical protein
MLHKLTHSHNKIIGLGSGSLVTTGKAEASAHTHSQRQQDSNDLFHNTSLLWVYFYMFTCKSQTKIPAPKTWAQGQFLQTVIPLCFILFSRRRPHKVPTHLCEITVATGKAYAAQAFSPQLTEGIHRTLHCCLTPTGSSLKRTEERLLISAQTL